MVDRKIQWRYVGIAFILTAIMFVGILFLGQELSKYKVDNLENEISQLETDQRSTSVTRLLADSLGERDCSAQRILAQQNIEELYRVREKVVQHHQSSKISSPRFEQLKKKYLLSTLENYIKQQNLEENCNSTKIEVLYFHTDSCDKCQGQGKMLTKFRKRYDQKMLVYPLDSDYDLEAINFLESYYQISEYPAIVVEDEVFQGFTSRQVLTREIESRINSTNSSGNGG